MKKILFFLLLCFPMIAQAYDAEINGIYYNFVDGKAEVTTSTPGGHANYSGSVTIPSSVTYNGRKYPVESIGNAAFNCSEITSITIPKSVTSIESYAFNQCYNLKNISMPNSLTYIGEYAFYDCQGLTSITIPDEVMRIERNTFDHCENLKTVTRCSGLTSIGKSAFSWCINLTSINLPDGLRYIEDNAFLYCSKLTSITIPDGVTEIAPSCFQNCEGLTSVTIPSSITKIHGLAFGRCYNLSQFYCYAKKVPSYTATNAFKESKISRAKLYVPEGSEQSYISSTPWNEFGRILPIENTAITTVTVDSDNTNVPTFDLQGRKIQDSNHIPGLVIKGSRKVMER